MTFEEFNEKVYQISRIYEEINEESDFTKYHELVKELWERQNQQPKESKLSTDEDLARFKAEVRREGYEAGVNDERLTHVPGWEDWMQGHAKGYEEGLLKAARSERERVLALLDKEIADWKEDEQTFPNGVILDERVEGIVQAFQILRDLIIKE
jgi:hypothetical protein